MRHPLLLTLMLLVTVNWAFIQKPKTTKGVLFSNAALFDAEKGKLCRPDSGMGEVIQISQPHENPLFSSKSPNMIHLFLHFTSGVLPGHKYTLPDSQVSVCYFEKGDLLMFHTFEGTGSIEFEGSERMGELGGRMDLKLVHPHHNMSNSDYHYLGGRLLLKRKALPD